MNNRFNLATVKCKKHISLILCTLLAAAIPVFAYADQVCDMIFTSSETRERSGHYKELLTKKLYAALEDELQARHLKSQRGEESDERIRVDFQSTFDKDPQLEPLLSEWIRLYPRSYSARLARAFYYIASGYSKRGREFSAKTSSEQFQAMTTQLNNARLDLDAAIPLSENPSLAYAKKIDLARFEGKGATISDILRTYPRSLAVKVTAVSALNPKWGGSLEKLDQLATFAQYSGMNKNEILAVKYYIELEKGNYYEVVTKQFAKAAAHYRAAGSLCKLSAPLRVASELSYKIEDWKNLIDISSEMLVLNPTDRESYQKRGWAYEKTGKTSQSIKDYEVAANLGASWAQNKLGWMLWQGAEMPKDTMRAKVMFQKSAEQGNKTAETNLKALNAQLGNVAH